ncbi:MAG: hypothetical protein K2K38_04915 [Clostridia bacterium]|nr:hypothetical protein [Clostridia bacterium]
MNKQRRKVINELIKQATELSQQIEEVLNEEQDYYDYMPENLQNSERGQNAEEAICNLEEAQSNIEDCISNLESAIEI